VGLAEQWDRIVRSLPGGWERADLKLLVPDAEQRGRAAALLGPLAPGRVRAGLRFVVSRAAGVGPDAARRLLANLDDERIRGTLSLSSSEERTAAEAPARPPLVAQWDALVTSLPEDWSDLLCRVTLASSDDVPRAALLCAPLNPSRPERDIGFDFRVARSAGYGASGQMTRRCFGRMDEEPIRGEVEILRALSDTHLVSTQGPVWYVDGNVL
jgi:hypothetical protein